MKQHKHTYTYKRKLVIPVLLQDMTVICLYKCIMYMYTCNVYIINYHVKLQEPAHHPPSISRDGCVLTLKLSLGASTV